MRDLQRLRKNRLARMKCIRSAARQRFCRITCGAWLGMNSRQRNGTQVLGCNVSQFNTGQGKGRLGVSQKSPDRQQKNGYDDDVPDKRCRKRASRQPPFNPMDAKLRILWGVSVHRGARAAEISAHAGAEFLPRRFPVHSQIEPGQARMHRQLFHRVVRLGGRGNYGRALRSLRACWHERGIIPDGMGCVECGSGCTPR